MHFRDFLIPAAALALSVLAQNNVLPPGNDNRRTSGTQPLALGSSNQQLGTNNQLLGTNSHLQGSQSGLSGASNRLGGGTQPAGGGQVGSGGGGQFGGPQTPFQFGAPAQALPQAQYITTHDCGGQKYDRGMQCDDQGNTGPENAVFIIAPGGTLSNCVIGPNQIEGVHCEGECVLENVWFEDVCEGAVTFRQEQGTSYVVGGGAFNAVDKIMNHNGGGTVVVQNYYAEQFGKIVRSCSDCNNMSPRFVSLQNVWAVGGLDLVGLNADSGDQAQITASCAQGVERACTVYQGGSGGGFGGGGTSGGGLGGSGLGGGGSIGGAGLNQELGSSGSGVGGQNSGLNQGLSSELNSNFGGGGSGDSRFSEQLGAGGSSVQLNSDFGGAGSGGSGGGSGSRFPGTRIDGDGLSVGDPGIVGSGPSQQCQFSPVDLQNCPPF